MSQDGRFHNRTPSPTVNAKASAAGVGEDVGR